MVEGAHRPSAALAAVIALLVLIVAPLFALAVPAAAQEDVEEADAGDADEEGVEDDAEGAEDTTGPARLFGTMRNQEGPVEGAVLSITDGGGTVVDEVTTDESGSWEAEFEEGGDFVVTVESLPDGVELRDPDSPSRDASVTAGSRQAVPFPLGEGAAGRGDVAQFFQQLLSGLRFGLIIAMTAVGLSLVFGTTGLINFAHGELVVFGAIVTWFINVAAGVPLLIAGALGVVASGALGFGVDRAMFRPLRRRGLSLFQLLVVTIGLSLVLRFIMLMFYGGNTRRYTDFVGQQQVTIGPFAATPRDLTIMAFSIVVLVGVATLLRTSRLGKAMRAVADNRDLAESSGIDVERVIGIVWIVGAGLAGLGGIFYGASLGVNYFSGFQLLLLMFAGVILGGLGTAYGAMVGSLVVGLITELSVLLFPDEIKFAWALGVLVLVLLVRPQGLLGRRERIG